MNNKMFERNLPLFLSGVLGMVAFVSSWWMSSPWCDELTFLDSGVNFLRTGHWHSNVFYLVNNPLFSLAAGASVLMFGASHQSVVFVDCLFAFLASWMILREIRRRNLLLSLLHEILFVFLYWGGWVFSGIVLNGRPDTMTLFFTVILLAQVFPADEWRLSLRRIFFSAFVLMLTSAYAIPLCTLVSAAGLCCKESRRVAFWRTFALVSGGVAAWFLIAAFYAFHHEAVRFLGFYAAFNTITGERIGTLADRALEAYTYDYTALALAISSLVAVLVIRRLRTRAHIVGAAAVLAVPFLMVCCGRYRPYYSWLFYVPSVVFAAVLCVKMGRKISFVALAAAVVLWGAVFIRMPAGLAVRRRAVAAERFVQAHRDCLQPGSTVLVADDTMGDVSLYYPLLARKVDLWFRGKEALTSLTDEKKFEKGLALFVKDDARRREILAKVLRYQRVMPYLPKGGFVLFTSDANREETQPLLAQAGLDLAHVASEEGYSLYRIQEPR